MPRSGVEARARLREAALELYLDHGYDATTTAQIAQRAGVTERTYFRHFADKREVLFNGESELRDVMVAAIADAQEGTPTQSSLRWRLAVCRNQQLASRRSSAPQPSTARAASGTDSRGSILSRSS